MWNELVVFLDGEPAREVLESALSAWQPRAVERNGLHVVVRGRPVEVYFDEPLWDSYSDEEREVVLSLLPSAQPVLMLFFEREPVLELLNSFVRTSNSRAYVDEGADGPLVLRDMNDFLTIY